MVRRKRLPDSCIIFLLIPVAMVGVMMISLLSSIYNNWIAENEANRLIPEYVLQAYPEMDLVLSEVRRDPKSGSFSLEARSPTSPDTHFEVWWSRSGAIYDDYQSSVLGGFNTARRLSEEMGKEIEPLLRDLFGDQYQGGFVDQKETLKLPLDTPYSRDLKLPVSIYLPFEVDEPTIEAVAEKLWQTNEMLTREGFSVQGYIIDLRKRGRLEGYYFQIDAEFINNKLVEALESAVDSEEYDPRLAGHSIRPPQ